MAGTAKPVTAKGQARYTLPSPNILSDTLFDNSTTSVVNYNRGYFQETNDINNFYVDINLQEKANIWVYGQSTYKSRGRLYIYTKPLTGGTWTLAPIQENALTNNVIDWQKSVSELPPGLYRFTAYGAKPYVLRIDMEWYIERAVVEKVVIKNGNVADSPIVVLQDTSADIVQTAAMTKTALGTGYLNIGASYDRTMYNFQSGVVIS